MVKVKLWELDAGGISESVTLIVNILVPAVVGVPVILFVVLLMLRPAGSAPDVTWKE
jgi:hypothetical protein